MPDQAPNVPNRTRATGGGRWSVPLASLGSGRYRWVVLAIRNQMPLVLLLVLLLAGGMLSDVFLTPRNLLSILWAVSVLGIIALGQTMLLISANFDMSVGYGVGLVGVAMILSQTALGLGLLPSIVVGLLVACLLGLFNGGLVVLTGASPFLITLGSGTLAYSVALALTDAKTLYTPIPSFTVIGQGSVAGIYYSTCVFLGLAILLEVVLRRTTYGRSLFVLGTNETAGRLAGVRVARTKVLTFILCSLLMGLAALMVTSRDGSTVANVGVGYLFDSIIAAVLGGTSLFGGFGGTLRTVVGVVVLGVLGNLLILLNVPVEAQAIVKGAVFLVVVWADGVLRSHR